jgi:hypothetical protein
LPAYKRVRGSKKTKESAEEAATRRERIRQEKEGKVRAHIRSCELVSVYVCGAKKPKESAEEAATRRERIRQAKEGKV